MENALPPELVGVTPANIPAFLSERPRWAMWSAVWVPKRGKYDKIPKHPDGYGISTRNAAKWCKYETALAALPNPAFAGIGYLMTGGDGLVGIDMDRCLSNGVVAPWAQAIVDQVGSYTEVSPSGHGLRIFTTGEIEFDWTNNAVGIEVYAGHTARFLTVTGHHVPGTPSAVRPAPLGALRVLAERHAKVRETATVISMSMPEIADPLALPDVAALGLPYKVSDYLSDGTPPCSDRSLSLITTATALHTAGLDTAEVFSVLANNEFTMGDALEKRGHDTERALLYLWVHHAQKGKDKASSPVATIADFEDVSEKPAATVLDDFEDVSGAPTEAKSSSSKAPARFAFTQVMQYMARDPLTWAIKGVIPMGEVGAIYGESGAGKSFLALDLVMAVATGSQWRGHRVSQGAVAYVCAEGAGGFALRAKAYADFHGNVDGGTPLHILGDAPNLLEKVDVKDLVTSLKALGGVSIIVIDTLAQSTPGSDENSSEGMGRALAHCKAIHRATGAMVLLVAHAGKDTSRGIRGWSGIKGALDVEICVQRSGDKRSATITKMKDGTGEGKEYGFALDTVVLGQDGDGDDITSCVLKDGAAPVNKGGRPGAVDWQQVVMDSLTTMTELAGAVNELNVLENALSNQPKDESSKKDTRMQRLKEALKALKTKGMVVENGDFISPAKAKLGA